MKIVQISPIDTALRSRNQNSTEKAKLADLGKAKLSYTHEDLKVKTNDDKTLNYLDRVRVSGKVGFPSKVTVSNCVLNNPLIESIK